jgi:hypothetical protein
MECGVVAVVQLNLSLRTGAGSTAQRLRVGLDLQGAAVLSRSRVRRLRERRAAESVNVGQTQRERDWCDAPASPYPSPSPSSCRRRRGLQFARAASGQELSRGLALKTIRGQADVTDCKPEISRGLEGGGRAPACDLYNGVVTSAPMAEENDASDAPVSLLAAL